MNRLSLTLLFAVLILTTGTNIFAQKKVDFSGKWKIAEKKSDFGPNQPYAAIPELNVTDTNDALTIKGNELFNKPLPYSGKVAEVVVNIKARRTKMTIRRSVKRSADGANITIAEKQIDDSPETITSSDVVEAWSLSSDKNELTIKHTRTQKDAKPEVMILVYTRQ